MGTKSLFGLATWLLLRQQKSSLRTRHAFLRAALCWLCVAEPGCAAALASDLQGHREGLGLARAGAALPESWLPATGSGAPASWKGLQVSALLGSPGSPGAFSSLCGVHQENGGSRKIRMALEPASPSLSLQCPPARCSPAEPPRHLLHQGSQTPAPVWVSPCQWGLREACCPVPASRPQPELSLFHKNGKK